MDSSSPSPWQNRRILLGISGGIAAYKACEIASTLAQAGAQVRAILTESAQQFITPLSLSTLCRSVAHTDADFWNPNQPRPLHIELGEWAEVLVIAPLTAQTLAKLAQGFADNLLTNSVLASTCPVLLAPAMNTDMWDQVSVQRNWQTLGQDPRYHSIGPGTGLLACDRRGAGRMAEPGQILSKLASLLHSGGQRDLQGRHLLISTGSTREFLDPVRFLGNPASGKMGIALAQAALDRGARVTLVHGPLDARDLMAFDPAASPAALVLQPVTTAVQMRSALLAASPHADWIYMAAAVADLAPAQTSSTKLPKAELPEQLPLTPVPDIAAELGRQKQPHQRLIGFAAQTGDIETPALGKLQRKQLDAIFANPVDQREGGFGSALNQGVWLTAGGDRQPLPLQDKLSLAHQLLDLTLGLDS